MVAVLLVMALCLTALPINGLAARRDPAKPAAQDANLKLAVASIGLEDKIIYSALVNNSVMSGYDSCYVEFTDLDSDDPRMSIHKIDTGARFSSTRTIYQMPIYVCQMTDRFAATLYGVKDGVVYQGQTVVQSVESFSLALLPQIDAYRQKLTANMLQYGAMMQINFNYRTEHLANDELGSYEDLVIYTIPKTENRFTATNNGINASYLRSRVLCVGSVIQMQYAFILSSIIVDDLYVNIEVDGKTTRVDGTELVKAGKYYVAVFEDLLPTQADSEIHVTVYDKYNDRAVSETYTDTLASAVADYQAAENDDLRNAVNALLNYYRLAKTVYDPNGGGEMPSIDPVTPVDPSEPTMENWVIADSVEPGDTVALVAEYDGAYYALTADTGISGALAATSVTVSGDRLTLQGADGAWVIGEGNQLVAANGKQINWTSGTGVRLTASGVSFDFTCGNGGSRALITSAGNRALIFRCLNGVPQFRAYVLSNTSGDYSQKITIWKQVDEVPGTPDPIPVFPRDPDEGDIV